jgi:hypothetical protein
MRLEMKNMAKISQDEVPTSSCNLHEFDSVSMCSYQSTVCESDIAEARLRRYERENQSDLAEVNPVGLQNNQINFQISVVSNSESIPSE